MISLSGCAQENQTQNQGKENKEMNKTLIVYFSATGTTKAAAQRLAKEHNADLYEITPEVPYTDADLNWRDKNSRSTLEMKDKSSRPAIKGRCENIADYDTVWIGFPVWWYTAPTIVNTFIEAHDLSGKVLNVFATSGGSDVKDSYNDLKKAYPQYKWGEKRLMNRKFLNDRRKGFSDLCGGIGGPKEIEGNAKLQVAFEMGKKV